MNIYLDAKIQLLEKERVPPLGLPLEQSKMGTVRMRKASRVSPLESGCFGLSPGHAESFTLSGR